MNPLDLRGPEFLAFYAGLCALALGSLWFVRLMTGARDQSRMRLRDPYAIASLRGGAREVVKLALVSLVDRGLLRVSDLRISQAEGNFDQTELKSIERAVLDACNSSPRGHLVFRRPAVARECVTYEAALAEQGLVSDSGQRAVRYAWAVAAVLVLWLVAAFEIELAVERGRHNVFFLVLMALAAAVVAVLWARTRRTSLGDPTSITEHVRRARGFRDARPATAHVRGDGYLCSSRCTSS